VHSGENIQELAIASNTYTANKQQNRYKDNKEMKGRLVRAWDVLDKYYSKTDEVIYYAAALILNPSYHVGYIKKNWPSKWRAPTLNKVKRLWASFDEQTEIPDTAEPLTNATQPRTTLDELRESLTNYENVGAINEYDDYCKEGRQSLGQHISPLEWWARTQQTERWPKLSMFARDVLAMPAMSDEPERIFSGARRTISWERAQLGWENIEKGECLKHWKRHGILEQKVLDLGEDGEVRGRRKRAKNSEKGNATLASTSGAGPYD